MVVIDCFEIFLDRASNPLARAQTYSSYKHHNTVEKSRCAPTGAARGSVGNDDISIVCARKYEVVRMT